MADHLSVEGSLICREEDNEDERHDEGDQEQRTDPLACESEPDSGHEGDEQDEDETHPVVLARPAVVVIHRAYGLRS